MTGEKGVAVLDADARPAANDAEFRSCFTPGPFEAPRLHADGIPGG